MALARAVGASAGIAGLILATAPEYWWMARSGTPDTAAASATALALTLFFLAWRSGRRSLLGAAAVSAGTAFWLKSLLGVGLASITIAAFLAWVGRGRLRTRDVVWAAVATGVGAALWLVLLWRAEGGGAVGACGRAAPRSHDMVVARRRTALGMPGSRPRPALPRTERRHAHGRDREPPSDGARAGIGPGADRRRVVGSGASPRAARVGLLCRAAGSETGSGRCGRRGVRDRTSPHHRYRGAPPVQPVLQHAPMG